MFSKFAQLSLIGALATLGTASVAQSMRDVAVPAEFPPSSYTGSQYVDSRGCVYIRAGLSGTVNWVPRVSRDRKPMCGFQPSGVAGATSAPARTQASAPIIEIPQQTTSAPKPAAAVAPAVVAAAPRVVTAPVAPVRSPSVQPAAQPRQISKAEVCAGRYGVIAGVVNARTGQPVDCGAAPVSVSVPTTPSVAPLQRVQIGNNACVEAVRNGSFAANGHSACAPQTRSIVTGNVVPPRGAVSAAPAVRAHATPTVRSVVPQVQGTAQASPWACLDAVRRGQTSITGPGGTVLNCAPQKASPTGVGRGLPARDQGASLGGSRGASVGIQVPRRSGALAQARLVQGTKPQTYGAQPPAGYKQVWTDGRMNPHRGITVLRF